MTSIHVVLDIFLARPHDLHGAVDLFRLHIYQVASGAPAVAILRPARTPKGMR
jgi:hypothetical protein